MIKLSKSSTQHYQCQKSLKAYSLSQKEIAESLILTRLDYWRFIWQYPYKCEKLITKSPKFGIKMEGNRRKSWTFKVDIFVQSFTSPTISRIFSTTGNVN